MDTTQLQHLTNITGLTVQDFFGSDGIIASVKPDFSPRAGQAEFSQQILEAAADMQPVIAEAPTGFGKSFAVLVPAIIAAIEQRKRVVISTETLTLQDQYVQKDLPLLQAACAERGLHFSFAVAKGRTNYVCPLKLDEDSFVGASTLMQWAKTISVAAGDTGDQASVPFAFNPKDWPTVCADEDCERRACPFYGDGAKPGYTDCFVYEAKKCYSNAQIIVTNHTLALIDLEVGAGTLLGPYDWLMVDEAHTFAEKAQQTWGTSLKPRSVSRTVQLLTKMLGKVGIGEFNQDGGLAKVVRHLEEEMFEPFGPVLGKNISLRQISKDIRQASREGAEKLIGVIKTANRELSEHITHPEDDPQTVVIRSAKEKLSKLTADLASIYGDNLDPEFADNWLVFMETGYNSQRQPYPILNLRPIEVAPLMKLHLFSTVPFSVFMSATMRIGKSFAYCRTNLGIPDNAREFIGESPFNFKDNVLGYFPKHLPEQSDDNYLEALCDEIVELINRTNGKSLVLFTNMSHMRYCHAAVSSRVAYHCFLQGEASRATLLESFQSDVHSCLFATRSFFAGIDIPGESLSCVILTKAPFPVPTEPMFKARADKIDEAGESSFALLSLPMMLFDVRQVFGRLIRTTSDKGMFALLDSRAMKKSYGSRILSALPEMQKIESLDGKVKVSESDARATSLVLSLESDDD